MPAASAYFINPVIARILHLKSCISILSYGTSTHKIKSESLASTILVQKSYLLYPNFFFASKFSQFVRLHTYIYWKMFNFRHTRIYLTRDDYPSLQILFIKTLSSKCFVELHFWLLNSKLAWACSPSFLVLYTMPYFWLWSLYY